MADLAFRRCSAMLACLSGLTANFSSLSVFSIFSQGSKCPQLKCEHFETSFSKASGGNLTIKVKDLYALSSFPACCERFFKALPKPVKKAGGGCWATYPNGRISALWSSKAHSFSDLCPFLLRPEHQELHANGCVAH